MDNLTNLGGIMLAAVRCAAIVFWQDNVLLTRNTKNKEVKWQMPERNLQDDEDILLCIRRCVLEQTGYRVDKLRLFRIIHMPSRRGKNPVIRFVFGCEIYPGQLHEPSNEIASLGPDAVLKLAAKGAFDDQLLLRILRDFKAGMPPAHEPIV
jgi:ADP-ribose pyrophosphatase YjhB (NUDIX family)